MDSNQLYINSSNAIIQARNNQAQISQKELELQLLDINNRYSNPYSYSFDCIKRQTIEMEIVNLKSNRDMHINYAIDYALMLAEQDIAYNNSYSMATIAIGTINSFISSYKVDFKLLVSLQMKISDLSSKLLFSEKKHFNLKSEINRLKSLCNIY